jgi:hypothetical protein
MKFSDEVKFIGLFLVVVASIAVMFFQPRYPIIKYDCRVAEISPDYPQEVKQRCREEIRKSWLRSQGNL